MNFPRSGENYKSRAWTYRDHRQLRAKWAEQRWSQHCWYSHLQSEHACKHRVIVTRSDWTLSLTSERTVFWQSFPWRVPAFVSEFGRCTWRWGRVNISQVRPLRSHLKEEPRLMILDLSLTLWGMSVHRKNPWCSTHFFQKFLQWFLSSK